MNVNKPDHAGRGREALGGIFDTLVQDVASQHLGYVVEVETMARFETLLARLYGHGEVLTADARRDLAHQFGLVLTTIKSLGPVVL